MIEVIERGMTTSLKNIRKPHYNGKTLTPKELSFLKAYTDEKNPKTFLNGTGAVRAAGYNCSTLDSTTSMARELKLRLKDFLDMWMDDNGLSTDHLMWRLKKGLDVKEIKFFSDKGIVTDSREVDAIEVQRRYLEMAMKLKGLLSQEPKEGGDITVHYHFTKQLIKNDYNGE